MPRLPFLTVLLSCVAMILHFSPDWTEWLQYDRAAVSNGQFWRLLTGHFTHFGFAHLKWDVLALLLFGSWVEVRSRPVWLLCLITAAVGISLGVHEFQPRFLTYRGLSGIATAFFALAGTDLMRRAWRHADWATLGFALVALGVLAAKSVFEVATGYTLFVSPNASFEPVSLAHLLGAATGIGWAFVLPMQPSVERPLEHAAQKAGV